MTEGILAAGNVKTAVAEYMKAHKAPPDSFAGLESDPPPSTRLVRRVTIHPGGIIRVEYRGMPEIDGRSVVLVPDITPADQVKWRCYTPDLRAADVPAECRSAMPDEIRQKLTR